MTFKQLVRIADRAYGGKGIIGKYACEPDVDHGDTLAKFIALKLKDTWDPKAGDTKKLGTAKRAIRSAAFQLERVADEFHDEKMEKRRAEA